MQNYMQKSRLVSSQLMASVLNVCASLLRSELSQKFNMVVFYLRCKKRQRCPFLKTASALLEVDLLFFLNLRQQGIFSVWLLFSLEPEPYKVVSLWVANWGLAPWCHRVCLQE